MEILVALLLVLSLATAGLVTLPLLQLNEARRRIALQDRHLARLVRLANIVFIAHYETRHNGDHETRLALDEAVADLATAAVAARKREPLE